MKKKLTRAEVISRLKKTLNKIKSLEDRKFNYFNFVSESKKLKDGSICGTVCCAAGWYPVWFPEANLVWDDHSLRSSNPTMDIEETLSEYHGINIDLVHALFFGACSTVTSKHKFIDEIQLYIGMDVSKVKRKHLIEFFEFVIDLLKKDYIDYKPY